MYIRAFTLIEVLVAFAVMVVVLKFGLSVSFDTYRRVVFARERDECIALLHRARAQAMNGGTHGLLISVGEYILFEGEKLIVLILSSKSIKI